MNEWMACMDKSSCPWTFSIATKCYRHHKYKIDNNGWTMIILSPEGRAQKTSSKSEVTRLQEVKIKSR
jgi:hypothetical protein